MNCAHIKTLCTHSRTCRTCFQCARIKYVGAFVMFTVNYKRHPVVRCEALTQCPCHCLLNHSKKRLRVDWPGCSLVRRLNRKVSACLGEALDSQLGQALPHQSTQIYSSSKVSFMSDIKLQLFNAKF